MTTNPAVPVADTIDDLTTTWFTDVLREAGVLDPQASVVRADAAPFGTGQLAAVVRVVLQYDRETGAPSSVVVKQPSTDEGSRGVGVALGMYRAEVRFYERVAPRVDVVTPEVFWAGIEEGTGRFTLVLEDLSGTADVGDMLAKATSEQTRLAMIEAAKLQAPLWGSSWITEQEWLSDLAPTRAFFGGATQAVEPFIARYADRMESHQIDLVRRLAPLANEVVDKVWTPPFVVAHGDYRLDNMMFGRGGGAPPVSVVDWQVARAAPPGIDPAIFLATCVDVEQRRANEAAHLRTWVDALADRGVRGFGYAEAYASYRAASLYPLLICVGTAVSLQQTERGDRMWAQLIQGAAELVIDTEADRILA